MTGSEVFEMQPFAGEYAATESETFEFSGESFEDEEMRARGFAPRGGQAFGRGGGRARAPIGARRPRTPTVRRRAWLPKPRPRPRWPRSGRPLAGPYYPLPALPLVEPVGGAVVGSVSSDEQLRCVRQCLAPGGDVGAPSAREPAPAPDQGDAAAPAQDGQAAADGTEGEFGEVSGPSGGGIGQVPLVTAIADPRSAGPGIYTLYRGRERLYVGRSNHLRRRLQQHLWCLTHLGVGAHNYSVKLTPMQGASPAQLQRVEAAVISRYGRQGKGGPLSNVKARELEQELFEAA